MILKCRNAAATARCMWKSASRGQTAAIRPEDATAEHAKSGDVRRSYQKVK